MSGFNAGHAFTGRGAPIRGLDPAFSPFAAPGAGVEDDGLPVGSMPGDAGSPAQELRDRMVLGDPASASAGERRALAERRARADSARIASRLDAERREARDWDRGMAERKMGLEERRIGLAEKNAEFERGRTQRSDEWNEALNKQRMETERLRQEQARAALDELNRTRDESARAREEAASRRETARGGVTGFLVSELSRHPGDPLTERSSPEVFQKINEMLGLDGDARITGARFIRESDSKRDLDGDGDIDRRWHLGLFRTEIGEDGAPHSVLADSRPPEMYGEAMRALGIEPMQGGVGDIGAGRNVPDKTGIDPYKQSRIDLANRRLDRQQQNDWATDIRSEIKDLERRREKALAGGASDEEVSDLDEKIDGLRDDLKKVRRGINPYAEEEPPAAGGTAKPAPGDDGAPKFDPRIAETDEYRSNLADALAAKSPEDAVAFVNDIIEKTGGAGWPRGVPVPTNGENLGRVLEMLRR